MKLVLVDREELAMGAGEEAEEHGMSPEDARNTALQHLSKKNPHYYSIAKSVGLEEEGDEIVEISESFLLEYASGFDSRPKARGTKGNSRHTQGIPTGKNFPFTQKSGRLWKIEKAAKNGPVRGGGGR